MSWTEQQIQSLKKMWGNYSASEIAKSLGEGMTRNAVIGKAHRLKLSAGGSGTKQIDASSVAAATANTMASIAKANVKKRVMLRPLPPTVQASAPRPAPQEIVREALRPIDEIKHNEGISVTKAGEHHCRWPIGDPRSPDFRFCGGKSVEGLPYCAEHARIAYQTISKRSRGSDDDVVDQRANRR